jgi:hypothetical protein
LIFRPPRKSIYYNLLFAGLRNSEDNFSAPK